ncbi:MAG TPA: helix-turn-helix transcriptional regulator [Thermoanaerobaculia bacterium]|nr:helix-turn-helix transcriptional regulator [Thermoanaerobaculia bacterium]
MARERLPDLSIALYVLREELGWSQTDLGEAAGTAPNLINDYERGRKPLSRGRLEFFAGCMGYPPERIDVTLETIEANRACAASVAGRAGRLSDSRRRIEAIASQFGRLATNFARAALTLLTEGGDKVHAHQEAEFLWRKLKRYETPERLVLVEEDRQYRKWGLCVRIVAESLAKAPNHPREALDLAKLALRLAELLPGLQEFRWRLQGYAGAALTNALRVCNDLPAARDACVKARKLWDDGAPGDQGLLNEALLPWVEAVLHREDREFPQALRRIKEALELDSGELRGKILLSKSAILAISGDSAGTVEALQEAAPLIDEEREPRDAFALRFNLLADLCLLDRADEAQQRLSQVRRLAEKLGGALEMNRVVWIEGKIWAGLGRSEEAKKAFEQARRVFRQEELAYDYAQVSLELSGVLLAQGHAAAVRTIAKEMFWIFRSQGVPREALAALEVFCDAARQETATMELTRRVVQYLHRARHDPNLPFEDYKRAGAG